MHRIIAICSVVAVFLPNCAAIKSGLASASASRIRGCTADQLDVSDTYGSDPVNGPKWKATCGAQVYECQGYMQLPQTVKCARL